MEDLNNAITFFQEQLDISKQEYDGAMKFYEAVATELAKHGHVINKTSIKSTFSKSTNGDRRNSKEWKGFPYHYLEALNSMNLVKLEEAARKLNFAKGIDNYSHLEHISTNIDNSLTSDSLLSRDIKMNASLSNENKNHSDIYFIPFIPLVSSLFFLLDNPEIHIISENCRNKAVNLLNSLSVIMDKHRVSFNDLSPQIGDECIFVIEDPPPQIGDEYIFSIDDVSPQTSNESIALLDDVSPQTSNESIVLLDDISLERRSIKYKSLGRALVADLSFIKSLYHFLNDSDFDYEITISQSKRKLCTFINLKLEELEYHHYYNIL